MFSHLNFEIVQIKTVYIFHFNEMSVKHLHIYTNIIIWAMLQYVLCRTLVVQKSLKIINNEFHPNVHKYI